MSLPFGTNPLIIWISFLESVLLKGTYHLPSLMHCMHIFGVEDIEHALEILGLILFSPNPLYYYSNSLVMIERFLSLETGDVELYLGDLSSLMNIGSDTF